MEEWHCLVRNRFRLLTLLLGVPFFSSLQPSSCLSDREEDEIYGFGYGVFAPRINRTAANGGGQQQQQQQQNQQSTLVYNQQQFQLQNSTNLPAAQQRWVSSGGMCTFCCCRHFTGLLLSEDHTTDAMTTGPDRVIEPDTHSFIFFYALNENECQRIPALSLVLCLE